MRLIRQWLGKCSFWGGSKEKAMKLIKPRIFVTKAQIEKAYMDLQNAVPDQWGYYCFAEYLDEKEACFKDLEKLMEKISVLEAQNEQLRNELNSGLG